MLIYRNLMSLLNTNETVNYLHQVVVVEKLRNKIRNSVGDEFESAYGPSSDPPWQPFLLFAQAILVNVKHVREDRWSDCSISIAVLVVFSIATESVWFNMSANAAWNAIVAPENWIFIFWRERMREKNTCDRMRKCLWFLAAWTEQISFDFVRPSGKFFGLFVSR